jgi:hypothetical protein
MKYGAKLSAFALSALVFGVPTVFGVSIETGTSERGNEEGVFMLNGEESGSKLEWDKAILLSADPFNFEGLKSKGAQTARDRAPKKAPVSRVSIKTGVYEASYKGGSIFIMLERGGRGFFEGLTNNRVEWKQAGSKLILKIYGEEGSSEFETHKAKVLSTDSFDLQGLKYKRTGEIPESS